MSISIYDEGFIFKMGDSDFLVNEKICEPYQAMSSPFCFFFWVLLVSFGCFCSPTLGLAVERVRVLVGRKSREEMGQQLLIYSFVAPATVIIAEYKFMGNLTSIASQCLKELLADLADKRP